MLLTESRSASTDQFSLPVSDLSQAFSAPNRQTYLRLRLALGLRLRRQVFLAVCDDLPLKNQLTQWLVNDLARDPLPELETVPIEATASIPDRTPKPAALRLVTLTLRPEQPDLQKQLAEWLSHRRGRIDRSQIAFQIVGIESLTRQSMATQRQFLNSLRALGRHYAQWDLNLVLWVTKPWFHSIRQSAPEFWRWYTGIFDFSGQPQVSPELATPSALNTVAINNYATNNFTTNNFTTNDPSINHPSTPPNLNQPFITQWLSVPSDSTLAEAVQNLALLHQQSSDDLTLADAYRELGNRYRDQPQPTLEILDLGIRAYREAFKRLPSTNPIVADLLNDIGNLHWIRSCQQVETSDRRADLESAIEHYQKALISTNQEQETARYIMLQNNLGATWGELAQHFEPATYLPHSISAYEAALSASHLDQNDAQRHANTQNNLGTAYWTLAQYQKNNAPLLYQAIGHYEAALQFYDATQYPMPHAMIQNNLGTAYWNFSQCENLAQFSPDNSQAYLLRAITAYQIALIYRTPESLPLGYAATQNNLGTAYWKLATAPETLPTEMGNILELTIVTYQTCLAMVESLIAAGNINFSFDPFATHHNLAAALYRSALQRQGQLTPTAQENALKKAFHHYQIAWQGWQNQPDYNEAAIDGLLQVLRAAYDRLGGSIQSQLLASLPPQLLSQIMPKI